MAAICSRKRRFRLSGYVHLKVGERCGGTCPHNVHGYRPSPLFRAVLQLSWYIHGVLRCCKVQAEAAKEALCTGAYMWYDEGKEDIKFSKVLVQPPKWFSRNKYGMVSEQWPQARGHNVDASCNVCLQLRMKCIYCQHIHKNAMPGSEK
eukprot:358897-Chlamydomonas_euryale.AAC.13